MQFHALDRYQTGDSFLHRLDPRVKLVSALFFILACALTPDGAWPAFVALALTVWMDGWASVPAVVGMGAAMLILRHWAIRRLGGITGDILGAAQVLGELGFLLGWLAWG